MIVDDTFLDRVAHDLRGELSTMLAGLQYMQRFGKDGSSSSRDMLERVSEAGDRLARLLEEFDDCAWLLDKPKPLLIEPLRLRSLVHDLTERSKKLHAIRGVQLHIDVLEDGEREFAGDFDMLVRALLYIVDFAMLRAPGSEVRATAGLFDELPIVRIEDQGPHVPDHWRRSLCDPFVENELFGLLPPGRRKVRIGLGLAISRAILEAHGGSVSMDPLDPPNSSGFAFRCVLVRP